MTSTVESTWAKPKVVDQVTYAFPADVVGSYLPALSEIPDEFKQEDNEYYKLAQHAFLNNVSIKAEALKEDVDENTANRHLSAVLRSFEPKHEHKLSGVAYLLQNWLK